TILRRTERVGVFKPIINAKTSERDKDLDLMLTHFNLNLDYQETFAFKRRDARDLLSAGQYNKFMDKIITKYKAVVKECDFILVEGTDYSDDGSSFVFNINVDIAKNLGCPVLILGRGDQNRDLESIITPILMSYESFCEKECQILGIIVNRTQAHLAHE